MVGQRRPARPEQQDDERQAERDFRDRDADGEDA